MLAAILTLVFGFLAFALIIMGFAYPRLLGKAGKFLFVKPVKAIINNSHHKVAHRKGATIAVRTGAVKTKTV